MKQIFLSAVLAFALLCTNVVHGQCSNVALDWDHLDFFSYTGNYTAANGYLSSNALSRRQVFAFGTQRLTIEHNYGDASSPGENTSHTGEAGSLSTGADVQFIGNGTVTFTFDEEVTNLRFSLHDIDRSQRFIFDARNTLAIPQNVSVTTFASTILSVTTNATPLARIDANSTVVASNVNQGSCNVTFGGPVRTLTITVSNTNTGSGEDGSYWISDIFGCSVGSFPTNYYNVSRPFTGQPGYVLYAFDKSVYALDPATGTSKLIFTDPGGVGGNSFINSMAYDPYKKVLYYVYSLSSSPGNNRRLMKYDFNTKAISVVLSDISSTTLGTGVGIPVVTATAGNPVRGAGVESGGAAFYNGALYLGIETGAKNINGAGQAVTAGNSGREVVIWKIDFNTSDVPYRASQVFAMPVDNGVNTLLHDWSDFVINNGVLYDFDGATGNSGSQNDIYQVDLLNRNVTNYPNPAGFTPGQPTVNWAGTLFQLHGVGGTTPIQPYVATYNGNGTIGASTLITTSPMFSAIPSMGDAAEGYRPRADFGDAPSSYDPDPLAPAVHEVTSNLHFGALEDDEWSKTNSANASADGGDEDGLPFVRIVYSAAGVYYTDVTVFNNTGANATVAGWVDFNGNGIFDASEGVTATVTSSATARNVQLTWTGIPQALPANATTYLRLRITSASNNLTTAKATGYMPNGEVEDYQVPVNVTVLSVKLLEFEARKAGNNEVLVNWKVKDEPGSSYTLERSTDERNWQPVASYYGTAERTQTYQHTDMYPGSGKYFYRLRITEASGRITFSQVRSVWFEQNGSAIAIAPNPTRSDAVINITSVKQEQALLRVVSASGEVVYTRRVSLNTGTNRLSLPLGQALPNGLYQVHLQLSDKILEQKLIIAR